MSRFRKLRKDPVQFFRDSRSPIGRGLGAVVARAMYGRDGASDWLADLPVPARVRLAARERDAQRRREVLTAAGDPIVSVVMAARDAEATVAEAAASVLQQTYERIELVAVDDASADRTGDILGNLAANDDRVTVLRNDEPLGVAGARNRGLSETTGAYLTFHDADDTAHPERIERQLAALLAAPETRVCLCTGRRVDPAGATVPINGRRDAKWVASMMFPRDPVFERLGYFLPLPISEDAEYYERIKASFGNTAEILLYKPLYFARFSPDSLLFSDGETRVDAVGVSHERSVEAEHAIAEYRARHDRIRRGELDPYVAR